MDETGIPQSKLDEQDYLNEAVLVPLLFFRLGGLEGVYRCYDSRRMRLPNEYFGHEPVKGFSTCLFDAYATIFNRKLEHQSFTDKSFMQLIAIAYRLVGIIPPDDVIEFLEGVKYG